MMLAKLDLHTETWRLARLVIALLQPALILLLILGLVVATAHLLTMIGTRWGDRRTSSKAMFFSVFIHLLLAGALIALIPEYRAHVIARLSELDERPIRIVTPQEFPDRPTTEGPEGNTPLFDRIPETQQSAWTRTEAPPEIASRVKPLEKPAESEVFQPDLVPDRAQLPEQPQPLPQQEMLAQNSTREQARVEMNAEALPTQVRPEAQVPAADRQRSTMTAPTPAVPEATPRPQQGSADRLNQEYSPDRQAPDLAEMPRPDALLPRSEDLTIARREAPAPAAPVPEKLGQTPLPQSQPARGGAPADPALARMESRLPTPSTESTGLGRVRPRTLPSAPDMPLSRPENTISGQSEVLPLPVEQPQLARQTDPFMRQDNRDSVPSAYRLRTDDEREKAIQKFGGSIESEEAVDRSLKWLASVQNPNGYWDASEYGAGKIGVDEDGVDRKFAGREADAGVTALAVLAFLGKLNTLEQGEYSPTVNRALHWIISQQTSKSWGEGWGETPGYLGGNATDFEAMYCHAMATFAIAEAYAMSRDNPDAQWLRAPLEKAIYFILDTQNIDGGWRYIKGQREGDMSIFGWQVMALKSAEAAGIVVDESHKVQMRRFLADRRRGQHGGLAGYRAKEAPSVSMTAEALYCRQMLGMPGDEQSTGEALQMLMANLPRRTTLNFYYWYYGTLALYQRGGPEWEAWNLAMRDLLVTEQRRTGPLAGSWDPRDVWGGYGGRIYSTSIATLSLEVYYRYLPLYRLNEN